MLRKRIKNSKNHVNLTLGMLSVRSLSSDQQFDTILMEMNNIDLNVIDINETRNK